MIFLTILFCQVILSFALGYLESHPFIKAPVFQILLFFSYSKYFQGL